MMKTFKKEIREQLPTLIYHIAIILISGLMTLLIEYTKMKLSTIDKSSLAMIFTGIGIIIRPLRLIS